MSFGPDTIAPDPNALTPEQWATIIDGVEGPTYNTVADAVAGALDVSEAAAFNALGAALADGTLAERDGPGSFPWITPTTPTTPGVNGGGDTDISSIESYTQNVRISADGDDTPPELSAAEESPLADGLAIESGDSITPPRIRSEPWWVCWVLAYRIDKDDSGEWTILDEDGAGKQPIAPYATGHARPVPWNAGLSDDEYPTTTVGSVEPWVGLRLGLDLQKTERVVSDTIEAGVILPVDREHENPDGITIIDWDDVRDPETREIHPVALDAIREVGGYVAISQSSEGLHQWVYGDIPDGSRKFIRNIDTEPFVPGSDDLPAVEIYTAGRLVAMTGKHVAGTGRDVVDGQDVIDRLCWEFGTGTNNAPGTPTDPYGRRTDPAPSSTDVRAAMREAVAYDGPDPEEWSIPDDDPRSIDYHAVLRARERSDELTSTANWELLGYAAALGYADGLDQETVVADLRAHPTPQYGFDENRAQKEVRSVYRKADSVGYEPPSRKTLVRRGILPERFADTDAERDGADADSRYVGVFPEVRRPRETFGTITAERPGTDDEDDDMLTVDAIWARTISALSDAMESRQQAVVDAVMGAGKTYNAFKAAHAREDAIFYASGRKALYEQGRDYALDVGFSEDDVYVLPSPDECPTFDGEHGAAAKEQVRSLFGRGVRLATMHKSLDLPCCAGDAECEYQQRNKFDPDDYDVLIGHYKHTHIPRVTAGRHVVVDENPTDAFLTRVEGDALVRGINAFLSLADSPDVASFDDLLTARHDPERRAAALDWFTTAEGGTGFGFDEADEQNAIRFDTTGFHAYAPHAVYAILSSEPVGDDDAHGNRRYPFEKASLPGIDHAALFFSTDEQNGTYFVEIQTPPELEYARSVIALDGTPLIDPRTTGGSDPSRAGYTQCDPAQWSLALGRPMRHRRVLSDDERAEFLRDTMGHRYVQTSRHIRPYSSGKYADPERDAALLAIAADEYFDGEPWDVTITSKKVRTEYEDRGFTDPERGLTRTMDHRGDVRGSDEYATCRSGVILGSAHHGDHELGRLAAWLDVPTEPQGKGVDRTYGPVGDAVLEQMRELDTAQCALRIGRGKDGRGAIVLIDTTAIPNWLPVVNREKPGDVSKWAKGERAVREAVADHMTIPSGDTFRTDDVSDALAELGHTMTPQHLRRGLKRHADRGLLRKERDPDDGRAWVWVDTGLADMTADATAVVKLPTLSTDVDSPRGREQTTNILRIGLYTQNVRISRSAAESVDWSEALPSHVRGGRGYSGG